MPVILLQTKIYSTPEICFDLSRSIDLHKISTSHTREEAVAGVTSGLINLNETVTWQAIHFGVKQRLTSQITEYERPYHFTDRQTKGIFKYMNHQHIFEKVGNKVCMKDQFEFQSPFGLIGKIFDSIILKRYMRNLLMSRIEVIKEYAESNKWKSILKEQI